MKKYVFIGAVILVAAIAWRTKDSQVMKIEDRFETRRADTRAGLVSSESSSDARPALVQSPMTSHQNEKEDLIEQLAKVETFIGNHHIFEQLHRGDHMPTEFYDVLDKRQHLLIRLASLKISEIEKQIKKDN